MIKLLIVDDSAFMRNAMQGMITSDPDIEVVGTARDGIEAIEKVDMLNPDVVTMDVEMPRMDGLSALRHIMEHHPVPVLMVSSLTIEGAKSTLDALDIGAVDFIPKNLSDLSVNIVKIKESLIEKIKMVAKKRLPLHVPRKVPLPRLQLTQPLDHSSSVRINIVVIGSSTGGPRALQQVISRLPKEFPVPVLIAQHMPPNFTAQFAERLNQLSAMEVKEAEDGEPIRRGTAYIAPGRGHMCVLRKRMIETTVSISENKGHYIYRPSVDALMLSAADIFSGHVLGVILTGLGNDGERGMRGIKDKGGRTFAECEESCVVYGMPKAVIKAGLADKVLHIDDMAGEIMNAV